MFGSHLSIAGSIVNALDEASALAMDTVQVFTKNQQQWKAKPLTGEQIAAWKKRVDQLGWGERTVSHASYLINLASPDDELWKKSVELMTDEIERCEQLGIPFLVHHPGAFTTSTREDGLKRIAKAYRELFTRTKGYRTVSCLENTVGSGSNLGREFTELGELLGMIETETSTPARLGVCFDTCHAHAGGYDLSTTKSAKSVIDALDEAIGLPRIKVLHLNDSKGACSSRLDRHAHIGQGTIGLAGFEVVVSNPAFEGVPKIMETPKEDNPDGVAMDTVNLNTLKGMMRSSGTKQPITGSKSARRGKRA